MPKLGGLSDAALNQHRDPHRGDEDPNQNVQWPVWAVSLSQVGSPKVKVVPAISGAQVAELAARIDAALTRLVGVGVLGQLIWNLRFLSKATCHKAAHGCDQWCRAVLCGP